MNDTDKYETDFWIRAMFPSDIWFDPCPIDWSEHEGYCGLESSWGIRTFVNPPYSNILPWVKKAIKVNKLDGHTVVMLLKHDSSTKWYKLLHEAGAMFLPITGRLYHNRNKQAPFPSVLAVLE